MVGREGVGVSRRKSDLLCLVVCDRMSTSKQWRDVAVGVSQPLGGFILGTGLRILW